MVSVVVFSSGIYEIYDGHAKDVLRVKDQSLARPLPNVVATFGDEVMYRVMKKCRVKFTC